MSDSSDVVQRIQESSSELRRAAAELTERILWYEKWLGNLPGRVAASVSMGTDPDDQTEQFLQLARNGKEWSLYVSELDHRTYSMTSEGLLRDSSIATKAIAVQYFPKLLEEIHTQQKMLLSISETATKSFDVFAKSLPQKEGK